MQKAYGIYLPATKIRPAAMAIPTAAVNTRGVQKVRGPTKKENDFYDETRCEGCDVTKRPLTQPLANRSYCFAQAVGCCKNVCYFVESSDARQGAVIPFVVLQKSVARVIHEYLLATPGEYYLPKGVSKRGLSSSKLVDRTLKMTSQQSSTSSSV